MKSLCTADLMFRSSAYASLQQAFDTMKLTSIGLLMMHQLLTIAMIFLVVIFSFNFTLTRSTHGTQEDLIVLLSSSISVMMIILYALHIFFQYQSHADLYDGEHDDYRYDEDGEQGTQLSPLASCSAALLSFTMMTACAIFLVEGTSKSQPPVIVLVGMFMVPIGLKLGVHLTVIQNAQNNKMDRALDSVIGSTLRTIRLLAPVFFFLSRVIGQPITLLFNQLQVIAIGLAVLSILSVMASGTSTFLNGAQLLVMYAVFH